MSFRFLPPSLYASYFSRLLFLGFALGVAGYVRLLWSMTVSLAPVAELGFPPLVSASLGSPGHVLFLF